MDLYETGDAHGVEDVGVGLLVNDLQIDTSVSNKHTVSIFRGSCSKTHKPTNLENQPRLHRRDDLTCQSSCSVNGRDIRMWAVCVQSVVYRGTWIALKVWNI